MIRERNLKRIKIIPFHMVKLKPYSSSLLALAGMLLVGMGLFFIFIRPPLLPEDLVYMQSTIQNVSENLPGLMNWLQKVFWVMGGYIFTTGVLTVFISLTSFRNRHRGAFGTITLAGISSIGLMTAVNFMIGSDFKWLLFTFMILWVMALVLYRLDK